MDVWEEWAIFGSPFSPPKSKSILPKNMPNYYFMLQQVLEVKKRRYLIS